VVVGGRKAQEVDRRLWWVAAGVDRRRLVEAAADAANRVERLGSKSEKSGVGAEACPHTGICLEKFPSLKSSVPFSKNAAQR